MDDATRNALILEAKKLALDANRLCLSLKVAGADDAIRYDAGQAYISLGAVFTALHREA